MNASKSIEVRGAIVRRGPRAGDELFSTPLLFERFQKSADLHSGDPLRSAERAAKLDDEVAWWENFYDGNCPSGEVRHR